jgi:predicted transcriptional regulator
MKKNKKLFLAISVMIMVTVSSLVMVFANPNQQNDFIEQGPIPEKGHPIPGVGPVEEQKLLALLQVDESTLRTERESGKTLVVIANEHGVSEQALKELLIEEMTQHIDEDVKEGRISAYQAQKTKADMEEHVSRKINEPDSMPGKRRPGPRPVPVPGPMKNSKLLALLQVDESSLRMEREAGKTLVAIANEHGVSEQALKKLLIEEKTQRIDEDVNEGRISVYQAKKIKADMEEHVSREINDPGPMTGKVRPISGPPILEPAPVDEQKEHGND